MVRDFFKLRIHRENGLQIIFDDDVSSSLFDFLGDYRKYLAWEVVRGCSEEFLYMDFSVINWEKPTDEIIIHIGKWIKINNFIFDVGTPKKN